MLTVYECITVEHDLRLVALAGFLCMFASFSALHLLARAREDVAWRRLFWILGAGSVAGCGIWATHFIAMLAYRPDYPVSYHTGITVLSFVVAVIFSTAGFAVAVRFQAAALGGAIVGLAICAMHYIGMSAISVHGFVLWDRGLVAGSIITGTLFAAAALTATSRLKGRIGIHAGWMLLTLAICSLHFTGMAAINMSTGPDLTLSARFLAHSQLDLRHHAAGELWQGTDDRAAGSGLAAHVALRREGQIAAAEASEAGRSGHADQGPLCQFRGGG